MSLNKAIKHNKEHRKPYTGAKAVDCTCRNHGGCDRCKCNRLHQSLKVDEATKIDLKDFNNTIE